MRTLLTVLCLLCGGAIFAEEVKVIEIRKPHTVVVEKVKVVPKKGVAIPVVRPFPGSYYWKHPTFGYGWWYYPAPAVAAPADFYLDQYGRVVPNGYAYDPDGNLVPLAVAQGTYVYPYRWYGGRYWWHR